MKKRIDYLEKTRTLLNHKGVTERKHASTVADILSIHYNSAKQKLDGKRGITLDEVKKIYQYFGTTFIGQRSHNAVFISGHLHQRCNITLDENPITTIEEKEHYAVEKDGLFIVHASEHITMQPHLLKVKHLDFLPPPRIAILDNDSDLLELLQSIIGRFGIQAHTFQSEETLLQAMARQHYAAYILDWLLDFGKTPENAIQQIREETENPATIIILTGQLNHYEQNISEMILDHDVHLIEKPAKPLIISSLLLSNLFFS